MKKSRKTRLTALMFAAAGVGCMFTVGNSEMLYRIPAEASVTESTTTTTCTVARAQAARAMEQKTISSNATGDVDGNGISDAEDIRTLQKYLLGENIVIDPKAADLYADGVIDIFDLGLLKRDVIEEQNAEPTEPPTTMQTLYGPPAWLTTSQTTTTTFTEPPTTMQTLYGPPAWFTTPQATTTFPMTVPLYGPPEWFTTETTETEEIDPTQPIYGPPSWFTTETSIETTEPTAPTETTVETLYGPPAWLN